MKKKEIDPYFNHQRTQKQITIPITTYQINNIQVCCSWYGNENHKSESCQFLRYRKFGTIPICLLTDQDIPNEHNIINQTPDWCPIKLI